MTEEPVRRSFVCAAPFNNEEIALKEGDLVFGYFTEEGSLILCEENDDFEGVTSDIFAYAELLDCEKYFKQIEE